MRVLVTDSSYKQSKVVIRRCQELGHEVFLETQKRKTRNNQKKQSVYIDRSNCLNQSIEQIKHNSIDVILPIGGGSVNYYSQLKNDLPEISIPIPSQDKISRVMDKFWITDFVQQLSLKAPKTLLPMGTSEHMSYPCVVKEQNELIKSTASYARSLEELGNLTQKYSNPLIQEYIKGEGVGFFAYYKQGQMISYFMHRRIRELPVSGGASTCAEGYYSEKLFNIGKLILDELSWDGLAMLEFKKTDSEYYFIEMNPKFWGSFELSLVCGVDFTSDILAFYNSKDIVTSFNSEQYKLSRVVWPLDGDIERLFYKPTDIWIQLMDYINPQVLKLGLNVSFEQYAQKILRLLYNVSVKRLLPRSWKRHVIRVNNYGIINSYIRYLSEKNGIPYKQLCKIDDYIWLGPEPSHEGLKYLNDQNVNVIIDVRGERSVKEVPEEFEYHNIGVNEFESLTQEQLLRISSIISKSKVAGKSVYIHCREGVSRSAQAVVFYYKSLGMTYQEAEKYVKETRPFINILPIQRQILDGC